MPHCTREGWTRSLVEMLLTTPTSHGWLQLQVERSACSRDFVLYTSYLFAGGCVSCGGAPTRYRPAHLMLIVWQNSALTWSVKLKHNGDMGMGHLWFKWVGQLWQSELLLFFRGKYALKKFWSMGSLRDWNLWSCSDWKNFIPLLHYFLIRLFQYPMSTSLPQWDWLFIMKEKLITHQIKMQPGSLPCYQNQRNEFISAKLFL